jgi:hypothetical protein
MGSCKVMPYWKLNVNILHWDTLFERGTHLTLWLIKVKTTSDFLVAYNFFLTLCVTLLFYRCT